MNPQPVRRAQPFRKADFVIEAAPEDEEIKMTIFRKLDQVLDLPAVGWRRSSAADTGAAATGHSHSGHPRLQHEFHLNHPSRRRHQQAAPRCESGRGS